MYIGQKQVAGAEDTCPQKDGCPRWNIYLKLLISIIQRFWHSTCASERSSASAVCWGKNSQYYAPSMFSNFSLERSIRCYELSIKEVSSVYSIITNTC